MQLVASNSPFCFASTLHHDQIGHQKGNEVLSKDDQKLFQRAPDKHVNGSYRVTSKSKQYCISNAVNLR